jgi:hypothetical protein
MRVTKSQIVHGAADYLREEVLPKMADNRAMQILLTIGANAALANGKTVDAIFSNNLVRAFLEDDGTGTYDIAAVADALRSAVEQYGSFPVRIPAIPFLSPNTITLNLGASDVDAIRRRIENAV